MFPLSPSGLSTIGVGLAAGGAADATPIATTWSGYLILVLPVVVGWMLTRIDANRKETRKGNETIIQSLNEAREDLAGLKSAIQPDGEDPLQQRLNRFNQRIFRLEDKVFPTSHQRRD